MCFTERKYSVYLYTRGEMTNANDAWVKASPCTEYYPVQQPKVKNGALIEALQHFQNVQSKPTVYCLQLTQMVEGLIYKIKDAWYS